MRFAITVAVFLALLLGCSQQTVAQPDIDFTRDMMAHHGQAVNMAIIARDRSQEPKLRLLALDITLTQQGQIGIMTAWLEQWGQSVGGSTPPMAGMGEMMGMASLKQLNSLKSLPEIEAEISFLQLMIRHHQGGVYMAEDVLATTKNPQVKRLAEGIVAGQSSEIKLMTEMLATRKAVPSPKLERMKMNPDGTHAHP
jgi:uncharacterized protein (DUF305 family)